MLSAWEQALEQIRQDPTDPAQWRKAIDLAVTSNDFEKITAIYEWMLETYPDNSSIQITYLNHYLRDSAHFPYAEGLFARFMGKPSVELLQFYLRYIRSIKAKVTPITHEVLVKCYAFALSLVGQDEGSHDIWLEYIALLRTEEARMPWEEKTQSQAAIRRAYQQAIKVPMKNVQQIWDDYRRFELSLDVIAGEIHIASLGVSHARAYAAYVKIEENFLSLWSPPPTSSTEPDISFPVLPIHDQQSQGLVKRWRQYLLWEESDPLELGQISQQAYLDRVRHAYRKAMVRMRYYPEIWFMAHVWASKVGNSDEGVTFLVEGLRASPGSYLLNFALAETLEMQGNCPEARTVFKKFLAIVRDDVAAVTSDSKSNTVMLKEVCIHYGVGWIMYIRFLRRTQGLKSAREAFAIAQADPLIPWQVYEAMGLMEYHCNPEDAPRQAIATFEQGLTSFGDDAAYVLRYLEFLLSINHDDDARALFERTVGKLCPNEARPLWERWARYEYFHGDLTSAHALGRRMAAVYPNGVFCSSLVNTHIAGH
ncbi:hypothetical protein C8Q76DRAFT_623595 [Earliella scabrosa]|nr:hypothetical protein C8Q76DRAFT_623595 [Earliella scabrosa]